MPPEKKKVTIRDIARLAGVSTATVSRYLNHAANIEPATAERIANVIAHSDYRPSRAAQSLKNRRAKNILLVVPDITNHFYATMARTIQALVREDGYALTLYDTNEDSQEEIKALALAREMDMSGILFASIDAQQAVLDSLRRSGIPTVMVNSYDHCPFDSVHGVRGMGTRLSAGHLLTLGHRRIAFAGGPAASVIGKSRRRGYRDALREAGIEPSAELIFEMGFSEDCGYKAGRYFSTLSPMPTAICCANDQLAFGVLRALSEIGLRVPQDVSVTGMDDIVYARSANPPLTTVSNNSTEFAQTAVQMLFERIGRIYEGEPREAQIQRQLILRASTGAPPV